MHIFPMFNTVSSVSPNEAFRKIQSSSGALAFLLHNDAQVFREFYPKEEDYVTLECVWNTGKSMLVERTNTGEIEMQERDNDGEVSVGGNEARYKTIESVLGDDEPTAGNADAERSPHMKETTTEKVDNTLITENPRQKNVSQASSLADTGTSAVSGSLKLTSNVRKVAFVSVKRPVSSTANPTDVPFKRNRNWK
ncbi:hypothetical protein V6N13_085100 [Hibiscus sabdariffa]